QGELQRRLDGAPLARARARLGCRGVVRRRTASLALPPVPACRVPAAPMVKPNASRALAIATAATLLGAAAFAVHELGHHLLRREGAALLGPVSKGIVMVLFAFVLLLACRHLCMLGLAAWEHWLRAAD